MDRASICLLVTRSEIVNHTSISPAKIEMMWLREKSREHEDYRQLKELIVDLLNMPDIGYILLSLKVNKAQITSRSNFGQCLTTLL